MQVFPEALAHGRFEEIFPDVFFITGAMETVLMEKDWQFSRNMIVVRENSRLIILNSIRLDEEGLASLDKLGTVTDVIRVGALHGRDDAFYLERYAAKYWTLPGVEKECVWPNVQTLSPEIELPIGDASVFLFEKSKIPESLILLEREGGILIGCDAIQNWLGPDSFFSEESISTMTEMGFFVPANIGPVWAQIAEPTASDFQRVKQLEFTHALCGHGQPLLHSAKREFLNTFAVAFGI